MQPWDQVKVVSDGHPRDGTAGFVIAVDKSGERVTVRMDEDGSAVAFSADQLKLLGR
ncbi:hypothetical protein D9X30_4892 [Cupriavidus sp. U2]|uniref:hypothetical protein n=1 Tax=Cupriavidus sp. U2 TaxID=2920269 RepID=UPI00129D61DB|nr:hypothetical protein [Cupriavidus sp. U2]KAI3589309.1 hypothetical protein D9X30_4892 [Cupriavidus sp. U2]